MFRRIIPFVPRARFIGPGNQTVDAGRYPHARRLLRFEE